MAMRLFVSSISIASSVRSVRMPRASISPMCGPMWMPGNRSVMPWSAKLRWSIRAATPCSSRASLHMAAQVALVD